MNLVWHSKLRGPHLVGAESTGNLTPQPDFPHFWYSRSEAATTDGVSLWNKKHLGENMCRCMLAWNYVKGLAIWEMNQKTEPFQRIWERFGNKTTFVKPNSQHHPPRLQVINFISQHVPFLIQQSPVSVLVVNIFSPYMLKFAIGMKLFFMQVPYVLDFILFNIFAISICSKYAALESLWVNKVYKETYWFSS